MAYYCSLKIMGPQDTSAQALEYLLAGLEKSLSTDSVRVQVLALSVLTDIKWASNPLVDRFLKDAFL